MLSYIIRVFCSNFRTPFYFSHNPEFLKMALLTRALHA